MKISAIDTSHIEAMVAQLKTAAAKSSGIENAQSAGSIDTVNEAPSFSDVLKSSLGQVNTQMQQADDLGKRFALGDDSVSLSDTMISMQKASLSFQATVQVRNKLVSAYHDIMAMQV